MKSTLLLGLVVLMAATLSLHSRAEESAGGRIKENAAEVARVVKKDAVKVGKVVRKGAAEVGHAVEKGAEAVKEGAVKVKRKISK